MAIYEADVTGTFEEVLTFLSTTIVNGSSTCSLEESTEFQVGDTKVAIHAYERYGWLGDNRVSLHLTVVSDMDATHVTVISTGGSQGMIFKFNTISEDNFLRTVVPAIQEIEK